MRSRSTKFIKTFFQKILDLSELSPNVNSLDIDKKTLAENLTKNLCCSPKLLRLGSGAALHITATTLCTCSALALDTLVSTATALRLHAVPLLAELQNALVIAPRCAHHSLPEARCIGHCTPCGYFSPDQLNCRTSLPPLRREIVPLCFG